MYEVVPLVGAVLVEPAVFLHRRCLDCRNYGWGRFYLRFVQNAAVVAAGTGLLRCDSPELPAAARAVGKLGPDEPRLGHADAVPGAVYGQAGLEYMIAGGEEVFAGLFLNLR